MPNPNADRHPGMPVPSATAAGADSGRRPERTRRLPAAAGVPVGGRMILSDDEIKGLVFFVESDFFVP